MAYDFTATKSIGTKPMQTTPYTISLMDQDSGEETTYNNTGTALPTTTTNTGTSSTGSCPCTQKNSTPEKKMKWMDILLLVGILVGAAVLSGYLIKKFK